MKTRSCTCTVCGSTFEVRARGRLPMHCSAECKRELSARWRLAWREANPDKYAAQKARSRAGRALFIEVACLVCDKPIAQPRRRRGRHVRTCSEACWQEQKRRTNRKHRAKIAREGAGQNFEDGRALIPVPPSCADFFPAPASFGSDSGHHGQTGARETLGKQGVETSSPSDCPEFFPIIFISEPQEPKP